MGRAIAAMLVASGTIGLVTSGALGQADAPLDDFEREDEPSWAFSNGPEFAGASGGFERLPDAARSGTHGGRLSFDFSAGGAYVQATIGLPAEPPVGAVELFARKTVTNSLTVRAVDQEGQTFQKSFNFPEGDWRHLRIRMDGWGHHWGGPNDGVFHGNPTSLGLLVERGEATTGAVDFDDLTIVPVTPDSGRAAREYVAARFLPEEGWGFWVSGPAGDTERDGGRVRYDFSQGASELRFGNDEALLGRPVSLRLRVRSDGSGHEVRMSFGSHFQGFSRTLGALDERGEMVLEAPLGGMAEWDHGGGENDGVVRLPLRLLNLTLAKREGGPERGEVEFLDLSVQTDVPSDRLLFPLARGPVAAGDPFRLTLRSLAAEPVNAQVTCSLRDFSGRVLGTEEHAMALPASAQPVLLDVVADVADAPFVEAEFGVQAPGQKPTRVAACWTMPWPDEGSAELDPASPWGMGLYLYRYGGDAAGLAQMDRAAGLARAAGVKWTREEFQWHRMEPRPGEYDWTFYDALLDTATRHGISVYGLIAYWSSWTQPYTDQGVEDYCRFVRALVGHYKDRIKHWEIWNEPNIFFWSGPKEVYFTLLDRAYAAVKEVDPEAIVFGCSTAGIDQDFIRRTMEAGARFDGLTIHPYRAVLDDMGFQEELRQVADLAAAGGPRKPVWITEMGWPTEVGGTSERDQASLLARCYVGAVASGTVGNVSWYDFREDGSNPYYNEHHFGIVRQDFSLKPAYRAAASVCRTLAGLAPAGIEVWGPRTSVLAHRFGGDGRTVTVVWAPRAPVILGLPASADVRVTDLMGQPLALCPVGDRVALPLPPGCPVFVEGSEPVIGEAMPLRLAAEKPAIEPGGATRVTLETGDLRMADTPVRWGLPPGWQIRENGPLTWLLLAAPDAIDGAYDVSATLGLDAGELPVRLRIRVTPAIIEI